MLSICTESKDSDNSGILNLNGSSGVVGMTIYYPEQKIQDGSAIPYPYTFYVPTHVKGTRTITVKDVTVLNGYKGVGTKADLNHESLIVDNVKGTFLHTGLSLRNQSDVGRVNDVTISSKYWLEADIDGIQAVNEEALKTYLKDNAVGIQAEGLEWTSFRNITIDGCKTGIRFDKGSRLLTGWTNFPDSGLLAVSMIDVCVTDCTDGLFVAEDGMDSRWGSVISRSEIRGKITNNSNGILKFTDVTVDQDALNNCNKITVYDDDLSSYTLDYEVSYKPDREHLYAAYLEKGTSTDVSEALQTILNQAGQEGGGIVYVPGGTYRLDNKITVPQGVELRGASAVANREQWIQNGGTVFLCHYGNDSVNPTTDDAFITLNQNAGLNGIRILYPENGAGEKDLSTTYTVRGNGSNVYVVNCCIVAAGYGIDFRGCNNHLIQGIYSGCWYNTFLLGGDGGILMDSLHNGTVIHRTNADGLPEVWGDDAAPALYGSVGEMLKQNSQYIILDGATNQKLSGVTACTTKNMIVSQNSTNTLAINVATDKILTDNYQFILNGGSMTVINAMRYPGQNYSKENEKPKLFGSIYIGETIYGSESN